jgi:hypothetical protein
VENGFRFLSAASAGTNDTAYSPVKYEIGCQRRKTHPIVQTYGPIQNFRGARIHENREYLAIFAKNIKIFGN